MMITLRSRDFFTLLSPLQQCLIPLAKYRPGSFDARFSAQILRLSGGHGGRGIVVRFVKAPLSDGRVLKPKPSATYI